MNENDKSRSGLQTAVDFAHAARAVKRIMQAAAVSGVHGAGSCHGQRSVSTSLKSPGCCTCHLHCGAYGDFYGTSQYFFRLQFLGH